MASMTTHVVYLSNVDKKCNVFRVRSDLEKAAKCKVTDQHHLPKDSTTVVFLLKSQEDVNKVLRIKDKIEKKHRVSISQENPATNAGKAKDEEALPIVSISSSPVGSPESNSASPVSSPGITDQSRYSLSSSPEASFDVPDSAVFSLSPIFHFERPDSNAWRDPVPTPELVKLLPHEIRLLRLSGQLDKLGQSLSGVDFTSDSEARGMYLLGPPEEVKKFRSGISKFVSELSSKEWQCSEEFASLIGNEPAVVAHIEREFEQKKVHAILHVEKKKPRETYMVLVWGASESHVKDAILKLDTMLTTVTLKLTPEMEAALRDHENDDSVYNIVMEAQGLMQVQLHPSKGELRVVGVKSEVEWWNTEKGFLRSSGKEAEDNPNIYTNVCFADREENSACPDLPSNLRRLLYRQKQFLREQLKDINVDPVYEEGTVNPYLHLYGEATECRRAEEKLKELAAQVREDEFVLPDLAIISLLDKPEGGQLLTQLEDQLLVIVDVNNNRTFPDSYYSASPYSNSCRDREVERVTNEDGSFVYRLKAVDNEYMGNIYEEVEDFYRYPVIDSENTYEVLETLEWQKKRKKKSTPEDECEDETNEEQGVHQRSKPKVPNQSNGTLPPEDDNYVFPSTTGSPQKMGKFVVQEETTGDGRVQLVASNPMLKVLVEKAELSTLICGADVVINFVTNVEQRSSLISSLIPEEHRLAVGEEVKTLGESLTSRGVVEGEAVGDLGCGAILHVLVKAGSEGVKDAVHRVLTFADESGQRVLVLPCQGLLVSDRESRVSQICQTLVALADHMPSSLREVRVLCPDSGTVRLFSAALSGKVDENNDDIPTYGDVKLPESDNTKVDDVTELDWANSDLYGLCNKEMKNVFLRITYMAPLTLEQVVQRLKDKFYRHILALTIENTSVEHLYHYQCLQLFKTVGENIVVVVQKSDHTVRFLGSPDEAPVASHACKPVLENAFEDYKKARNVEWCFVNHQDMVKPLTQEDNCKWESTWRRHQSKACSHLKHVVEGRKFLVDLNNRRMFPFNDPSSWMPLLRVDKKLQLPKEWERSEHDVELLQVGNLDYDYATAANYLKKKNVGGQRFNIIKVERVKNARVWRQFRTMRSQITAHVKPRSRFSFRRTLGPDYRLWRDVSVAQAKDILILGLRALMFPGAQTKGKAPERRRLRCFSKPHLASQEGRTGISGSEQRVLVQVEVVADCLRKEPKTPGCDVQDDSLTCLVDNPSRPTQFHLASHVQTYPCLFITYTLV